MVSFAPVLKLKLKKASPMKVVGHMMDRFKSKINITLGHAGHYCGPLREVEVSIPMASMVDFDAERNRLQKEMEQTEAEVGRLESRLKDEAFLTRAPAAVVDKERQKLYTLISKLERLREQSLKF